MVEKSSGVWGGGKRMGAKSHRERERQGEKRAV
jgi:hypothetical protein